MFNDNDPISFREMLLAIVIGLVVWGFLFLLLSI